MNKTNILGRDIRIFIMIIIIIGLISIFIYPTIYEYHHGDRLVIKINCFTGETEYYTISQGWVKAEVNTSKETY